MSRRFIEIAALSDAGSVRQFNEDSIAADPEIGLAVLADGMGGHRAGEIASRMAADLVFHGLRADVREFESNALSPLQALEKSINRANSAIFEAARSEPGYNGMGTTLAVTLFHDNRVALGHIGDSRIYRVRSGKLAPLTRDDSLLSEEIDGGWIAAAEASASHNRSLVTRALGIEPNARPHLTVDEAHCGDVYLLCSDGLHDLVEEADIELIVDALKSNLPLAAGQLVQAAKDNGGFDNVSVILARIVQSFPARRRQPWKLRWLSWLKGRR